ncbi:MAG: class I SAM-dependent methyltransferase [Methanothrix sp.]
MKPLTDMDYAECFNAFKKVSTEWMAIEEWLAEDFMPSMAGRQSANVLSIGSGTGDFDLTLMRMLLDKVPTLSYTALDPNEKHNKIFLNRYSESGLNLASFQIIAKPFCEDFFEGGFDLVHLTHCLYYIPDRKMAIHRAFDMLNPGGILLIFHQTPLGINEIQRIYLKQVKGDEKELFSSYDILLIMKELSLKFNFNILISDIDVTDCIEGNETGQKILNFFLESNLDGLGRALHDEIIRTLKEICQYKDGRYLLFHPSGIFWIRKDLL